MSEQGNELPQDYRDYPARSLTNEREFDAARGTQKRVSAWQQKAIDANEALLREIEELKVERDELRQHHIEETNHLAAERDRVVRNAETAIRNVTTVGGQQRARITELEAKVELREGELGRYAGRIAELEEQLAWKLSPELVAQAERIEELEAALREVVTGYEDALPEGSEFDWPTWYERARNILNQEGSE